MTEKPTFYTLVNYEADAAFYHCDDNGAPQAFDTEAAAIEAAKIYDSYHTLILKTVALVTHKAYHRITKIK